MDRLTRKACLVLMAMGCAMWSFSALAYENEPKAFRGITWGTPVMELSDMVLVLDGGALKAYVRKGDEMSFGEADLDRIHYIFYKERFYCVHMEFSGASNYDRMKRALVQWYGPGEEKQGVGKNLYWVGATASVILNYSESEEKGELGFKYMPIDAQIDADERG